MTVCVAYKTDIENMIIANLDGWTIETPTPTPTVETVENQTNPTEEEDTGVNPFMTSTELQTKSNKIITRAECKTFYEEALDMAYAHTNRFNIDDLNSVESRMFIRAVCKWTASNLWNKYNIRVNNEDMEDTYVQSYGGLLYKSALKGLQPFINQRITSMSSIKNNTNDSDDNLWIV